MLELRHLKTLEAINSAGNLSAAAERLHLTQSALSHQIKELELRLGTALFIRKTRPLKLTVAGLRLFQLAQDILPAVRATEYELSRLAQGQSGRLHIAIECHSCFDWLMPTVDQYRNHWPDIELDMTVGFNFMPLPALLRGDVDLVLSSDPQPIEGIYYEPLFSYEALLALRNEDPLTQKPWATPADLAERTLITYPVERNRLDVFSGFLDPAGVEPQTIRTAELTMMILQLVASGRGVSVLPNWALAASRQQRYIATLPLGEHGLWRVLYLAMREEQRDAPYLRDFVETAKQTCFRHLQGIERVT
ncbi:MAG: LysR family transcriptional regulator [Gammaproteobacteria bacterium]|nr:LysR family transcriptional regulator [Gammaproteobacteria bacterium]